MHTESRIHTDTLGAEIRCMLSWSALLLAQRLTKAEIIEHRTMEDILFHATLSFSSFSEIHAVKKERREQRE